MNIVTRTIGPTTEFCLPYNDHLYCFVSASYYNDTSEMVISISSQKGCPMSCTFCDIPSFGFHGNCSISNISNQFLTVFNHYKIKLLNTIYIHYARMGEPTFNPNILSFTSTLKQFIDTNITTNMIKPTLLTMLPVNNPNLQSFLNDYISIIDHNGNLQFSINSTSNTQRNEQFNNQSLQLEEISDLSNQLPKSSNKYILNFAVTKDTIIEPDILDKLFDKDKFQIKITPIHENYATVRNKFNLSDSSTNNTICREFKNKLKEHDWDVKLFI